MAHMTTLSALPKMFLTSGEKVRLPWACCPPTPFLRLDLVTPATVGTGPKTRFTYEKPKLGAMMMLAWA